MVDDELLQSIQAPLRSPETLESYREALATMVQNDGLVLAPIKNLVHRDDLAQVADFLFATSNTDLVIVYGIQRQKMLLSARSRREHLHIGLALSKEFPDGQAGGHRVMAGGQVLLSNLGFEVGHEQKNLKMRYSQPLLIACWSCFRGVLKNEYLLTVHRYLPTLRLLGTAHVATASVEAVKEQIETYQPKIVGVELCKTRHDALVEGRRLDKEVYAESSKKARLQWF